MLKVSRWLLVIAAAIMIVDQVVTVLDVAVPIAWIVIAQPGMSLMLGTGLVLFGIKSEAFKHE